MKNPIPTLTLLVLTAGAAAGAAQFAKGGKAELRDSQGKVVGTAQLKVVNEGVQVSVQLAGIPAGTYAFHIHSVGKCEAPTFESAGAHFNPGGKKHGLMNPEGPHAGDLPNINVEADGKGKSTARQRRVSRSYMRMSLLCIRRAMVTNACESPSAGRRLSRSGRAPSRSLARKDVRSIA